MIPPLTTPLLESLWILAAWATTGLAGSWLVLRIPALSRFLYGLLALESLFMAHSGFRGLAERSDTRLVLAGGIPGLPFHFRQDPLSSFFLLLLGAASVGTLIYTGGFMKNEPPRTNALFFLRTALFLSSMGGVFLADDAYIFMLSWELMALVSFFMILTERKREDVRRAGYLYLLMAHGGSLLILFAFALLASHGSLSGPHSLEDFSFSSMSKTLLSPPLALLVFLLAVLGFGAKAGILPLHVWLPLAHPAAPAPASALLSGIMLKTAVYGLLRILFGLEGLPQLHASFGIGLLLAGGVMALFGILYALLQSNPKSLLAYSSIENIGIILLGIGLSILYLKTGHPAAGAVALSAALYHAMNHAFFKSLLFLGAGTMVHATGETDLNRMGGLLHKMPLSGLFVLVGVFSISGLPPTNGFVSEWLLLQATLQAPSLSGTILRSAVLFGAALLVLSSALAAMGFLKFFGIGYLGQPRSEGARDAHECSLPERIGMGWLTLGTLFLGFFPAFVLSGIRGAVFSLSGADLPSFSHEFGWTWLLPFPPHGPSTSPIFLAGLLLLLALPVFWLARLPGRGRRRSVPAWGCGYPGPTERSQASAESFAQPIRHFFPVFFSMKRHIPTPDDPDPVFSLAVEDPHWPLLYRPLFRLFSLVAESAEKVRTGRISVYLVYSFATLLFLLSVLRWR
ncbi:MAG: hydrogenase 4 subunit B [Leptospirales bacterium]